MLVAQIVRIVAHAIANLGLAVWAVCCGSHDVWVVIVNDISFSLFLQFP